MRSKSILTMLFAYCALATAAYAACPAPSKPGAVLCFPTTNASVSTPFNIEGAATGDGLPIRSMIVYVDNQKAYEFTNTGAFVQSDYVGYFPGWHHVVLNAWDSDGHLFQASAYFNYLFGVNAVYSYTCSTPATGVHLCLPSSNTFYPESDLPVVAQGSSAITSLSAYVNGVYIGGAASGNFFRLGDMVTPATTPLTVTVIGKNSQGQSFTASASGIHTYYDRACVSRNGCDPGITITYPATLTDQSSPFKFSAEVSGNPHVITSMRVYLDNTSVLNSTGPTIAGTIPASAGTHLLTVQAWDTTGALYKTQETVNVQ